MSSEVNRCSVLFVSHVSSKKYGGAERVLDDLISGLDRQRFKTVLLLQKTSTKNRSLDLDWKCASGADIEYFNFGSLKNRFKLIALMGMIFRIIKGILHISILIKKYNVDIICANTPIAGAFSAIPARLFCKRFIYYEHNLADQRKGHLIGLALKPVAYLATDIICISKSVKQNLVREGVPESKLHLIYNGYDFKTLDNVNERDRKLPARYQKNVLRVGMVANFISWKRHQLFLELVDSLSKAVPEIRIEATIVGGCLPGNEGYYEGIIKWVEDYTGPAQYILTGFKDNVSDYLCSFDVLINPAKAEPFGLIFLEAMYLGCVVIGSDEGAAPEILEDGVTGYTVDFDNSNVALQRLIELSSDLHKRIDMGKNASLMAPKRFSIDVYISQVEELFDKIC